MKLSEMITSYVSNPRSKAKLKKRLKLDDGTVYKKGTVSEILIKKNDGTYHFEANNSACTVTEDELEFI
jgi:hypothetical protein